MNIQDVLNALSGLDQKVGLGAQPIPPPMAPPSSPLAALLNLRSATPGSISDWMHQGQAGADFRNVTSDYASDQLAAGMDAPPPNGQAMWDLAAQGGGGPQPGMPSGSAPAPPGDPGYLYDLMTKPRPSLVPQTGPDLQYPAPNQGMLDIYNSGQGGGLAPPAPMPGPRPPPGVAGDVTDFPGRPGASAGGSLWDSILGALAPNPNADPTQNAEIGPAKGGLDSIADLPRWLHDTFGIGKGAPAGPQAPGILDQIAGQMNDQGAAAGKGKGAGGGGVVASYGLGRYQEPPSAPHEAIPPAMDLSGVMNEIRAAEPQRVPLGISKGTSILEGLAHGLASGAGHGFGTQLLAGAAGGLSGEVGYAHDEQRNEQNFQRAMQDFHYRVAEGELHQAQLGDEHNRLAAEIDYKNQSNDYNRQLSIIEAHKPQAQMTPEGLVVQQINPKTGQYEIKIDSRPIDHILEARMALRGMGASPASLASFTGQATGANGHHAGPADAALNLAVQLTDRPDLWPGLYGNKFQDFNTRVQSIMGKGSAYGTLADDRKGKLGQMQTDMTSTSAVARMLQNDILADSTGETAKRAVGLLSGQAVIGAKNQVQANPFGMH